MPDGIDTNYGINYQNMVGVLRVLEFINEEHIISIEFESKNDELEDININYENYILLEQVKKKEHSVWTKNQLKPILKKYLEEYKKVSGQKEVKFRFTTQAGWNKQITELLQIQSNLIKSRITQNEMNEIKSWFDCSDSDLNSIITLFKNTEFIWNYFAPNTPEFPFDKIKTQCINELSKCKIITLDPDIIINKIIEKISSRSSSKIRVNYTATDFENHTGIPAFINDHQYIIDNLGEDYLKVIDEIKPYLMRKELKLFNSKQEEYIIPIYIEVNNLRLGLWIINSILLNDEINDINHHIKYSNDINHIIISINSSQKYDITHLRFKEEIIVTNPIELKSKLEEIIG